MHRPSVGWEGRAGSAAAVFPVKRAQSVVESRGQTEMDFPLVSLRREEEEGKGWTCKKRHIYHSESTLTAES